MACGLQEARAHRFLAAGWQSGRTMARTGLRMMPTFPSPPLKFRTAGFPQYGFKASLSGRAFPNASAVKPAPGMPVSALGLHRPFAHFPNGRADPAQCPDPAVLPRAAVRETHGLPTPGVLGSGPSSVVSVHHRVLRPHPSVSPARGDFTVLPLIRRAFAVRERLGDPRDLPSFPCRALHACRRPYAGGSAVPFPLCRGRDARLPRPISESPPTSTRLCQQSPTGLNISALHRSRHAAARAFARPSGLAPTRCNHMACPSPSEDRVTPAFDRVRRRAPLGVRLEGRTGNLPSSGLSPDQFTASSEAAR